MAIRHFTRRPTQHRRDQPRPLEAHAPLACLSSAPVATGRARSVWRRPTSASAGLVGRSAEMDNAWTRLAAARASRGAVRRHQRDARTALVSRQLPRATRRMQPLLEPAPMGLPAAQMASAAASAQPPTGASGRRRSNAPTVHAGRTGVPPRAQRVPTPACRRG